MNNIIEVREKHDSVKSKAELKNILLDIKKNILISFMHINLEPVCRPLSSLHDSFLDDVSEKDFPLEWEKLATLLATYEARINVVLDNFKHWNSDKKKLLNKKNNSSFLIEKTI